MGSLASLPGLLEQLPVALTVFDGAGAVSHKSGGLKHLMPDLFGVPNDAIQLGWDVLALDGTPLSPADWPSVRIIQGEALPGHTIGRFARADALGPERTFVCSVTPRSEGGGTVVVVEVAVLAERVPGAPELDHAIELGVTLADELMVRPFGPAESAPNGDLTERERSVLQLIAWGHSFKEIARLLSISPKTAEAHRKKAMNRLGLRSRNEIVKYAVEQGWFGDRSAFP